MHTVAAPAHQNDAAPCDPSSAILSLILLKFLLLL
jgi:hypothetical protein